MPKVDQALSVERLRCTIEHHVLRPQIRTRQQVRQEERRMPFESGK
jgi:hypothetical protein